MRELEVVVALDETPFDSMSEAIKGVQRTDRASAAKRDTAAVKGCLIEGAQWNDHELRLQLSNGQSVLFRLDGPTVVWGVSPTCLPNDETLSVEPTLLLRFPQRPSPTRWDRCELIRKRMGKRIQMIFAGTSWAYLYVENMPILLLQRLAIARTGESLLYWSDTT